MTKYVKLIGLLLIVLLACRPCATSRRASA